jgi:AcrR family transcriptional regulator
VVAAAEVLREYGYRAAPLDEILRRSGVAKSNLYYHFPGKLELACAAVDAWRASPGARAMVEAVSDESRSGLERIQDYIRQFVANTAAADPTWAGCPFGMLATEDDLDEVLRLRVEQSLGRVRDLLRAAVRAAIREGSLRPDLDPERFSLALSAALQGGGVLCRAYRDPALIQASGEAVLALALTPASERSPA